MKIRNGFVSNSSSSSFIAVGIDCHHPKFRSLMNAINFDLDWQRFDDLKEHFDHYDFGQFKSRATEICVYDDADFAGFDAEILFRKNMRLSEIKTKFIRHCDCLGVQLSRNCVTVKSGLLHGC